MSKTIYSQEQKNGELLAFPYVRDEQAIRRIRKHELAKATGSTVLSCKEVKKNCIFDSGLYMNSNNVYRPTQVRVIKGRVSSIEAGSTATFVTEKDSNKAKEILRLYKNGADCSELVPIAIKSGEEEKFIMPVYEGKEDNILGYVTLSRKLYLLQLMENGRLDLLKKQASIKEISELIDFFKFEEGYNIKFVGNRKEAIKANLIVNKSINGKLKKLVKTINE